MRLTTGFLGLVSCGPEVYVRITTPLEQQSVQFEAEIEVHGVYVGDPDGIDIDWGPCPDECVVAAVRDHPDWGSFTATFTPVTEGPGWVRATFHGERGEDVDQVTFRVEAGRAASASE